MKRSLFVATLVAILIAGSITSSGAQGGDDPGKVGSWGKPFAEIPLFAKRPPQNVKESLKSPPAVSIATLPDGRLVFWGGLEGIEDGTNPVAADGGRALINSRVRVLDIRNGEPRFVKSTPEDGGAHDMFCADQRLLANGKLLVVGGTLWHPDPIDLGPDVGGTVELFGSNAIRLFDPADNTWQPNRDWMRHPRWYPTLITMPSGDLLIASGVTRLIYNYSGQNVQQLETFDPQTNQVKVVKDADISLPLFPRLHLMPDGTVFYGGVGQMWGPFGQAVDEALWGIHRSYDPGKRAWTTAGMGAYGARSGAFSILMPLKAPYKEAQVLIGGGTLGSSPGSYVANNFTEIVTVKNGTSTSQEGPALNNRRWYSSGVLLPDGTVVALSGADRDEVILPASESPVKQAELFDGDKWIPLGAAGRVRTYHNSAILLADGSILVGGHAPINNGYGPKGDNSTEPVTGTNNLKDPSFEIFKPPYLFRGPRPEIAHVQAGIDYREDFDIATPQAGEVKKVVLSRLPTTTHITDADQRSVELGFNATSQGTLRVDGLPDGNVAPPGHYYLWILTNNGDGLTPSKARIVTIGRSIGGEATAPMGR
ncbi:MAG TPA: galactose oxidase-like domain-containing protein [Actinomycetota bacterium]|nr:galactose oxidase-like domain-containing protein [Actinomycetota bacterium]